MGTAVFNTATLRLVEWVESGAAPPVRSGLINVTTGSAPSFINDRYDGAGGVRAATQAELDADVQIVRDSEKSRYDMDAGLGLRALAEVVLDEINVLRALHVLPDRTRAQLRTAFLNKLDDLTL